MKKRSFALFLVMLAAFSLAVNRLEDRRQAAGKQQLEDALRRTAVTCYALEGFYPPDIAYMQNHYGLQYDTEIYIVHYELTASNWMPEITVLEQMP